METPYEHAIGILSQSLSCGYKACDFVFGVEPSPALHDWQIHSSEWLRKKAEWDALVFWHQAARSHKMLKFKLTDPVAEQNRKDEWNQSRERYLRLTEGQRGVLTK